MHSLMNFSPSEQNWDQHLDHETEPYQHPTRPLIPRPGHHSLQG